ncbi:tryptophan synthase subunit alpha [Paenibacillus cymbidii]|uniref:tryptophan synthase subunit alpha n=1 Tax=Paenibacillus cymbidii TaxID=1639034 RepID=UPI001081E146|nr:tryptophan synthase subunit alpha [Paenibacillus cymbidii]
MNRIDERFASLKAKGETALIPFLTIGDPDADTSVSIILRMEAAGADIIELGVPYSDPLADGPVIQRSSERALANKITILDCIGVARKCREAGSELPFILFTYYNPVLQLGLDRFFRLLGENEISGVIIPDLPIEENAPVRELSLRHGIHLIPLVAPTSNERIARIASEAAGFVYCVSSLGVTGTRSEFYGGINDFLAAVKQATDVPVAVGFGISTREQVEKFARLCDGAVVGSAIVRRIEEAMPLLRDSARREEGLEAIGTFVATLKVKA